MRFKLRSWAHRDPFPPNKTSSSKDAETVNFRRKPIPTPACCLPRSHENKASERERERAIFLQRLLQRRKQKNTPPQHLLDPPGSNPFPILPLQRNEREREEKKTPHSRHHMSQCDKSRNPRRRHQAPPPGLLQAEISTTKGAVESRSNASRTSQISKNRSFTHQGIKEKRTKHKNHDVRARTRERRNKKQHSLARPKRSGTERDDPV